MQMARGVIFVDNEAVMVMYVCRAVKAAVWRVTIGHINRGAAGRAAPALIV